MVFRFLQRAADVLPTLLRARQESLARKVSEKSPSPQVSLPQKFSVDGADGHDGGLEAVVREVRGFLGARLVGVDGVGRVVEEGGYLGDVADTAIVLRADYAAAAISARVVA